MWNKTIRVASGTGDRSVPDHDIAGEPGGWVHVTVHPAPLPRFSATPLVSLSVGTGLGTSLDMLIVGVGIGAVLALATAGLRFLRIHSVLRRLAPAGTISACPYGVRLTTGAFVPRHTVTHVACRNIVDGFLMVADAARGEVESQRPARWPLRHRHPARRIAYQIELQATGRVYPIIGRMTASTARHIHGVLSHVLGFVDAIDPNPHAPRR